MGSMVWKPGSSMCDSRAPPRKYTPTWPAAITQGTSE
jgi:hypothetical protein